ncbi:heparan-alpha-glucosaminide N-acetyltransferase domain-containing protein [Catenovulum sp. 2E275]|uniref:DUF1624 domain-containing protein n=1 Tax=Catenovulum sp. 2E275 TaxID=2980497 RepID=UPI0021D3A4F9|nr:heparan-alpha-glucosaminide N-acetyltransferase domain-containing protein [Catenovulum sp. 2E275]MCU4677115.1 heparan-alpha-glucosaminide N-acetyltransferase domain-containing protein [Catenovulum sp. 2E275]
MNSDILQHSQSIEIKKRIHSIDIMRGLVILIMILDHVRERFFLHHQVSDPMDLTTTDPALFWSRFAAHLCAPTFIFLTGLSAYLYSQPRQGKPRDASAFLFKRGIFLIVLEITLICFSWLGTLSTLYLQVIWAIGLSMIALAVLIKLPKYLLLMIGLAIVFGHNLLTQIHFNPEEIGYSLWTILHDRGYLITNSVVNVKVSYPVLPWIGVIILGYLAGPLYQQTAALRQKNLLKLALFCLSTFAVLRGFNLYGETLDWQIQAHCYQTLMDIFNLTKYPPSLNFLLITGSMMFAGLYLFERFPANWHRFIQTFGSVPMFVYILHLYVLLILYMLGQLIWGNNQGIYFGVNHISWIWLITLLLIAALYKPVAWFSQYKRKHQYVWLKYL